MGKSSNDGYSILLIGYARSPFESYLRILVGLNEEDFQLFSKQHPSIFVTYGLSPGIYTIEDFSEANYTMGYLDGILQIENDDISMNSKPILTRFS